jgi:hypothetical protein
MTEVSGLEEGTEMENEVVESNADKIAGLLKHVDMDSVELQHVASDIWAKKVVSVFLGI